MNFFKQFEQLDFPQLGYIRIPKIEISDEEKKRLNLDNNCDSEKYLYTLVKENFKNKIKSGLIKQENKQKYGDRLKFEFEQIKKLLFIDYIILVYKIIDFCNNNGILNSPARGSCGGSLLLYIIGVTKIDPLKHDLLFERFISAARTEIKEFNGENYLLSSSLADVDIDSSRSKKYKVNEFIDSVYKNKNASILTFGTFQSKSILKEVLKCTEGFSEDSAHGIAEMIDVIFGVVSSIDDTIKNNKKFEEWSKNHTKSIELSKKLHGLIRNKSIHASGIIICNDDLMDCMPTELSSQKEIVTSYTMDDAQLVGIKIDNLGLKNLDIIDECLKLINKKMEDIDVNDKSIYEFLNKSDNYHGIFQSEDGLGKNTLMKIKPQSIDDLAISISIGRPGSMRFIDDYIKFKEYGQKREIDSKVDDILNKTGNLIIFQETVMSLAGRMANFNPQERDGVRKAIGKKLPEKMKLYKEKFITESIKNGYTEEFTNDIWRTFEESGSYLFNASHGYGYSYLTAITTYLKANYPKEFFICMLRMSKHESDSIGEISKIHKEMHSFNIKLLRPHILKSDMDFKIEGNDIRFGLSSIKGLGEKAIEKLLKFKNEYSTKFEVFEGAEQANVNISVLTALIMAGAFEGFKQSRSKIVYEAYLWNILSIKEKKWVMNLSKEFDYDLVTILKELINKKDEKSKPIIKESRIETIKKRAEKYKEIYKINSKSESLCNFFMEKRLLGYTYGLNLKDIFITKNPNLINIREIKELPENNEIIMVGYTDKNSQTRTSKNGNKYLQFDLSDETGTINIKTFSKKPENRFGQDNLASSLSLNDNKTPKEEDIVIVKGKKKEGNCVFAELFSIQTQKIMVKLSDMKEEK